MQSTGQTSIHASHPVQLSARMIAISLGSFLRALPAPLAMLNPSIEKRLAPCCVLPTASEPTTGHPRGFIRVPLANVIVPGPVGDAPPRSGTDCQSVPQEKPEAGLYNRREWTKRNRPGGRTPGRKAVYGWLAAKSVTTWASASWVIG